MWKQSKEHEAASFSLIASSPQGADPPGDALVRPVLTQLGHSGSIALPLTEQQKFDDNAYLGACCVRRIHWHLCGERGNVLPYRDHLMPRNNIIILSNDAIVGRRRIRVAHLMQVLKQQFR